MTGEKWGTTHGGGESSRGLAGSWSHSRVGIYCIVQFVLLCAYVLVWYERWQWVGGASVPLKQAISPMFRDIREPNLPDRLFLERWLLPTQEIIRRS